MRLKKVKDSDMLTAIGLMSGTSLDGVDVAILKTDGKDRIERGPGTTLPYSRATRALILRAIRAVTEGREDAQDITQAAHQVTSCYVDAVRHLLATQDMLSQQVDLIGVHGQTILHRAPSPEGFPGRSWQIVIPTLLAREIEVDVVHDFRSNDMAAGGEGAPLVPAYHAALTRQLGANHPVAIVNIGGVANITYVPPSAALEELIAFDCGPGNGLVDEWMQTKANLSMDKGGAFAAAGTVHEESLRLMGLNPYLRRQPPKSLDRYDFKLTAIQNLGVEDGAATLTEFTAHCIARTTPLLPGPVGEWIIVGGGRHNPVLMAALARLLAAPVRTAEDVGWCGDSLEAECFAYLAVRSRKGWPISFPRTTRAPRPLSGGVWAPCG